MRKTPLEFPIRRAVAAGGLGGVESWAGVTKGFRHEKSFCQGMPGSGNRAWAEFPGQWFGSVSDLQSLNLSVRATLRAGVEPGKTSKATRITTIHGAVVDACP